MRAPHPARRALPRRVPLALLLLAAAPPAASAQRTNVREITNSEQVLHVLDRLAYGPRPGDVERVRAMGVDRWVAQQLQPERIADSAADALVARYATLQAPPGELARLFETVRRARQAAQRDLAGDSASKRDVRRELLARNPELREAARRAARVGPELQSAKLARAVASERQLQEVMVDFWENHFSVFAGKGPVRYYLAEYDRDVIRPHAFGKFRDLLGAVAKSPAMLFYLDNWQSRADSAHPTLAGGGRRGAGGEQLRVAVQRALRPDGTIDASRLPPALRRRWERLPEAQRQRIQGGLRQAAGRRPSGLNENYARELLELHTLGVDGGYTQQDVIDVARALTGWTFAPREGSGFVFRPQLHDAGPKVVLGHRLAAGRGVEDGEAVLDIVARHPATARFIARKLAVRFVSDTPPAALVERVARTFRDSDGDIRETLRTLFASPEFYSRAAYRAKVKTPFEVVASALRAVGAAADTTPVSAQAVARLGQPIFGRQTPDGWPDRADAWMNTGAILNRINFGLLVAGGRLPGAPLDRWPAYARLRTAPRAAQVDGVVDALLGGAVSPVTREVLTRGENPLLARLGRDSTAAGASPASAEEEETMMEPRARPGGARVRGARMRGARAAGRPVALDGLAQIVGLALGSPEFQRR